MKYQPVIGLEIHVQLKTKSKMFCRCSAETWNEPPNSHTCPVCLGLPGALPVANEQAIKKAIMVGVALNCQPQPKSKFDRKNYFYPDLPKGYQISQYDLPFSKNGFVEVDGKKIRITRAHLEEDTGKLLHLGDSTLIDFNRSGIPLLEIVSDPDIRSAAEAKTYGQKIQQMMRYLGVADADIEKGNMRLEPNISLRPLGSKKLPSYKVEVKNIGSMRSLEKATEFEIKRQTETLETGREIVQETRGWNEAKQRTISQRSKEFAHDYRYFPEPDLPTIQINPKLIEEVKANLPELPDEKKKRFVTTYGLSNYDAEILTKEQTLANFFEEAVLAFAQTKVPGTKIRPTRQDVIKIVNWIKGEVLANLNELGKSISEVNFTPSSLAEIVYLLEKGKITAHSGKVVLGKWMKDGARPAQLVTVIKAKRVSGKELSKIVSKVIGENPKAVADFTSGKAQALNFLLGQVIKATSGQVDPKSIEKILTEKLS